MGQLLNFGQVVNDLSIQRADVAVGYVGYCVLLDTRVMAKQVIFMDKFGFVEVTAEDVARYRKQPMTYYLMLVARLNTDPRGRLYGDDITVEYLRMSRTQYMDFQQSVQANPTASTVMLTKEKRVSKDGRDMSSVKMMAAQLELSGAISQKIELLKANPATIDGLFAQVDSLMGAPSSKYEEWLVSQRQDGVAPAAGGSASQPAVGGASRPQLGGSVPAATPTGYPASGYATSTTAPRPYGGPVSQPLPPQGSVPASYPSAPAPSAPAPAPMPYSSAPDEMGFGGDPFDAGFGGEGGF